MLLLLLLLMLHMYENKYAHRASPLLVHRRRMRCPRVPPAATVYLPPAASCSPWPTLEPNSAPSCAKVAHLDAGFASFIHHMIHAEYVARSSGVRFVPHHHPQLVGRKDPAWLFGGAFPRAKRKKGVSCRPGVNWRCLYNLTGLGRCTRNDTRIKVWGGAHRSFYQVARAAQRFLTPTFQLAQFLKRVIPRGTEPCIAVQLRYGDACGHNANHTARKCGPVSEYVRAVENISRVYGFRRGTFCKGSLVFAGL